MGMLVAPVVDNLHRPLLIKEFKSLRLSVIELVGFVYEALLQFVARALVHIDGIGYLGSGLLIESGSLGE